MAQKRMFDRAIMDTDKFMDMPMSTKALYFLLGIEADDEGFVSPKKVIRIHGGSDDDLRILIAKEFIIPFESGVVVITDWHKNNWLDSRRIRKTEYKREKKALCLNEDKQYALSMCLANAKRVEKRIEENSIEEKSVEQKKKRFAPPTVTEVKEYCVERRNKIDPEQFIDFYESKGWMIGKNKMKSWKASIRTWERKDKAENPHNNDEDTYTVEELEKVHGKIKSNLFSKK